MPSGSCFSFLVPPYCPASPLPFLVLEPEQVHPPVTCVLVCLASCSEPRVSSTQSLVFASRSHRAPCSNLASPPYGLASWFVSPLQVCALPTQPWKVTYWPQRAAWMFPEWRQQRPCHLHFQASPVIATALSYQAGQVYPEQEKDASRLRTQASSPGEGGVRPGEAPRFSFATDPVHLLFYLQRLLNRCDKHYRASSYFL